MIKKREKTKEEEAQRTKKIQVGFRNRGLRAEMAQMRESNFRIRKRINTQNMSNIKNIMGIDNSQVDLSENKKSNKTMNN